MKTKYVEPKAYMNAEMKKAFNAEVKKTSKPAAKPATSKKKQG